jgi:hypothetical protein
MRPDGRLAGRNAERCTPTAAADRIMAALAVRFFYFALDPMPTPQPAAFSAREWRNWAPTRDVQLPLAFAETSGAISG